MEYLFFVLGLFVMVSSTCIYMYLLSKDKIKPMIMTRHMTKLDKDQ